VEPGSTFHDPSAADARRRITDFFDLHLKPGPPVTARGAGGASECVRGDANTIETGKTIGVRNGGLTVLDDRGRDDR
jgi:hypothetical protein